MLQVVDYNLARATSLSGTNAQKGVDPCMQANFQRKECYMSLILESRQLGARGLLCFIHRVVHLTYRPKPDPFNMKGKTSRHERKSVYRKSVYIYEESGQGPGEAAGDR